MEAQGRKLALLSPHLRSHIRSGVTITSLAHCVEELVMNSIDAKSTLVEIRIDLSQCKIKVTDNGQGVTRQDLLVIGSRYLTSKGCTVEDLKRGRLMQHGYRGEALASIRHISAIVQIISKADEAGPTWSISFSQGKRKPLEKFHIDQPKTGTTVTAVDIMYNMPVRKKMINPALDIEDIRLSVCGIALSHPEVAITLKNEANGRSLVKTRLTLSSTETFSMLFGREWRDDKLVSVAETRPPCDKIKSSIALTGFFGKEGAAGSRKQFFYVNNRLIRGSKVHKLVRASLKSSIILSRQPKSLGPKPGSPTKVGINLQPVFCLFLTLPTTMFDIRFNPRKTEVEFDHWDLISKFIETSLYQVLYHHHFLPPSVYINSSHPLNNASNNQKHSECIPVVADEISEEEDEDESDSYGGNVAVTKNDKMMMDNPQTFPLSNSTAMNVIGARQSLPASRKPRRNVPPKVDSPTDNSILTDKISNFVDVSHDGSKMTNENSNINSAKYANSSKANSNESISHCDISILHNSRNGKNSKDNSRNNDKVSDDSLPNDSSARPYLSADNSNPQNGHSKTSNSSLDTSRLFCPASANSNSKGLKNALLNNLAKGKNWKMRTGLHQKGYYVDEKGCIKKRTPAKSRKISDQRSSDVYRMNGNVTQSQQIYNSERNPYDGSVSSFDAENSLYFNNSDSEVELQRSGEHQVQNFEEAELHRQTQKQYNQNLQGNNAMDLETTPIHHPYSRSKSKHRTEPRPTGSIYSNQNSQMPHPKQETLQASSSIVNLPRQFQSQDSYSHKVQTKSSQRSSEMIRTEIRARDFNHHQPTSQIQQKIDYTGQDNTTKYSSQDSYLHQGNNFDYKLTTSHRGFSRNKANSPTDSISSRLTEQGVQNEEEANAYFNCSLIDGRCPEQDDLMDDDSIINFQPSHHIRNTAMLRTESRPTGVFHQPSSSILQEVQNLEEESAYFNCSHMDDLMDDGSSINFQPPPSHHYRNTAMMRTESGTSDVYHQSSSSIQQEVQNPEEVSNSNCILAADYSYPNHNHQMDDNSSINFQPATHHHYRNAAKMRTESRPTDFYCQSSSSIQQEVQNPDHRMDDIYHEPSSSLQQEVQNSDDEDANFNCSHTDNPSQNQYHLMDDDDDSNINFQPTSSHHYRNTAMLRTESRSSDVLYYEYSDQIQEEFPNFEDDYGNSEYSQQQHHRKNYNYANGSDCSVSTSFCSNAKNTRKLRSVTGSVDTNYFEPTIKTREELLHREEENQVYGSYNRQSKELDSTMFLSPILPHPNNLRNTVGAEITSENTFVSHGLPSSVIQDQEGPNFEHENPQFDDDDFADPPREWKSRDNYNSFASTVHSRAESEPPCYSEAELLDCENSSYDNFNPPSQWKVQENLQYPNFDLSVRSKSSLDLDLPLRRTAKFTTESEPSYQSPRPHQKEIFRTELFECTLAEKENERLDCGIGEQGSEIFNCTLMELENESLSCGNDEESQSQESYDHHTHSRKDKKLKTEQRTQIDYDSEPSCQKLVEDSYREYENNFSACSSQITGFNSSKHAKSNSSHQNSKESSPESSRQKNVDHRQQSGQTKPEYEDSEPEDASFNSTQDESQFQTQGSFAVSILNDLSTPRHLDSMDQLEDHPDSVYGIYGGGRNSFESTMQKSDYYSSCSSGNVSNIKTGFHHPFMSSDSAFESFLFPNSDGSQMKTPKTKFTATKANDSLDFISHSKASDTVGHIQHQNDAQVPEKSRSKTAENKKRKIKAHVQDSVIVKTRPTEQLKSPIPVKPQPLAETAKSKDNAGEELLARFDDVNRQLKMLGSIYQSKNSDSDTSSKASTKPSTSTSSVAPSIVQNSEDRKSEEATNSQLKELESETTHDEKKTDTLNENQENANPTIPSSLNGDSDTNLESSKTNEENVDVNFATMDGINSSIDSGSDIFKVNFSLLEKSTIDVPESTRPDISIPDGWIEKQNDRGKTFWIHLLSGRTFNSPSKCFEQPGSPASAEANAKGVLQKRENDLKMDAPWPLPPGKSPFLPKKNLKQAAKLNKNAKTVEEGNIDVDLINVKWSSMENTTKEDISSTDLSTNTILSNWKNPVFKYEDDQVPNFQAISRFIPRESYKFDKKIFSNLNVVGQADRKFIAMVSKLDQDLLLILDHHAAHERVRLEALINEHYPSQKEVVSTKLHEPIKLVLAPDIVRVLSEYSDKINSFGLEISLEKKNTVSVTRVPECFLQRELSEVKNRRPSPLRTLMVGLIEEICTVIVETRGGFGILPKTIRDVLNSQACRGAIKFGDSLGQSQITELLSGLAMCQAPFQCAHGRPSLVPIINVNKLSLAMDAASAKHIFHRINYARLTKSDVVKVKRNIVR